MMTVLSSLYWTLFTSCSEREVAILACAVEDLALNKKVDAMKELLVVQVVSLMH